MKLHPLKKRPEMANEVSEAKKTIDVEDIYSTVLVWFPGEDPVVLGASLGVHAPIVSFLVVSLPVSFSLLSMLSKQCPYQSVMIQIMSAKDQLYVGR